MAKKVGFTVTYGYNQNVNNVNTPSSSPCPGGFGPNPYRITFELFRNGTSLGSQSAQYSSCWARHSFLNIPAEAGNYRVQYKFERYTLFGGWSTWENAGTNIIQAVKQPAAPNFTINGQAIPPNGAPITVNIGAAIIMDASSTQCATRYIVGVEESHADWGRTFKYEWNKWFNGAPPASINLQQLATTYSQPPDWLGQGSAQQGTPLIGGFFDPPANTQPRYYRVGICTDEPSWLCKHALLRVNY
ncbi:MAG TPA: hypothetical protein VKB93_01975 [Thermoanaerobaculia bacterium]|nr:hypothetical protein [Thermoanaerobaculia bacterium]